MLKRAFGTMKGWEKGFEFLFYLYIYIKDILYNINLFVFKSHCKLPLNQETYNIIQIL